MENKKAVLCQKTAGVNSYCRVCMVTVQPGKGIYIFGEKAVLRNLAAKMKKYLNLEVTKDDELSLVICIQCFDRIKDMHSYVTVAKCNQPNMQDTVRRVQTFNELPGTSSGQQESSDQQNASCSSVDVLKHLDSLMNAENSTAEVSPGPLNVPPAPTAQPWNKDINLPFQFDYPAEVQIRTSTGLSKTFILMNNNHHMTISDGGVTMALRCTRYKKNAFRENQKAPSQTQRENKKVHCYKCGNVFVAPE